VAEATTTPDFTEHRQRWLPVLAASRLAEPDGRAARLTLLGEELAAFRDSDGNLGVIDGLCPHNGSLLAWGVAEEGGLTCAYHAWAFDVKGRCLWVPGTSNAPDYLAQYNVKAYPLTEAQGLLWTFMGAGDPPVVPQTPWATGSLAGTHWQVIAPSAEAAFESERTAIGWAAGGEAMGGTVLMGPNGLQLWLSVTPSLGQGFHCLAVLWHPDRPLTEAEQYTMTDRASGPSAGLSSL